MNDEELDAAINSPTNQEIFFWRKHFLSQLFLAATFRDQKRIQEYFLVIPSCDFMKKTPVDHLVDIMAFEKDLVDPR